VSPEIAGEWLKALLALPTFTSATASAVISIAQRTDDSSRDIDVNIRTEAIFRLKEFGIPETTLEILSSYVTPTLADALRSFGESLPPGLQVVSSANCLLSLPALQRSIKPE
jgi:hypothetical protein